jgi:DNA-binding MarR family transcriptional regulator
LLRAYGRVRQVMDPYFARFGISASQWAILRVLQRAEAAGQPGLRLTDLGRRLLIQPPSVTAVVDRLERHGLLERRAIKSDQRARLVALTSSGRHLVNTVLKGHSAQIRLLFSDHNAAEINALAALLQKFEKRLSVLARAEQPEGVPEGERNNSVPDDK